ncbi:prokaryotic membrane lipolipid attachment site family protein [Neisseria sp. Ec49-e6-T10]|uniref:prokaryotic membrane lipolipid attachment site family protein n=1 Tax=Neisseria sp. Ec49-e6-T10 TaxID=3140744 RepID=UPI003EC024F6
MKNYLIIIFFSAAFLSGCATSYKPKDIKVDKTGATQSIQTYGESSHKILVEANRLANLVNTNSLTRVQAAQSLDRYRVELVGHNAVDDAVFSSYLRIAVDRQSGKISAEQSQTLMQQDLEKWQTRWVKLKHKPENPAFTNFLMQVFNLPPLVKEK